MIDAHSSDQALMLSLGLRIEDFGIEWTDLGTVHVGAVSTVQVEVAAAPAQFWRFTVTRPFDGSLSMGTEVYTVTTGSGSFRDYWPVAELVAKNMLDIEGPS